MKLIEFKEFNRDNIVRAINKKKVVITVCTVVITVMALTFVLLYVYNNDFRKWADVNVLMKVVSEGTLSSIEIDKNENMYVFAYDKYVAVVNENKLNIYNSSAKKVTSNDININNPIFGSNGKYLVIGDKGKQKIFLISGTKVMWEADIDGAVSRASVNESGYVSVVCTGSTYKSIICVYNSSGKQLFKTYIPNNTVIDSTISSDNKYLSFAEINTNKTVVESTVKTISVRDATSGNEDAIINTYSFPLNTLITNVKYQGSKNLICMCENGIYSLADGKMEQLMNFNEQEKKYSYAGVNLANAIYEVEEHLNDSSNQCSSVNIINTATKKHYTYSVEGIANETSSSDDNIAINLGTEVYCINSRGWLIKQYKANQEVKQVLVSDRLAAIVFRDKIEILVL